jgi:hypothetical protein
MECFLEKHFETFLEKHFETFLEKYFETFLEKYFETFLEKQRCFWHQVSRKTLHGWWISTMTPGVSKSGLDSILKKTHRETSIVGECFCVKYTKKIFFYVSEFRFFAPSIHTV